MRKSGEKTFDKIMFSRCFRLENVRQGFPYKMIQERQTDRQRQKQTERDRDRKTETERQRQRDRDQRQKITLAYQGFNSHSQREVKYYLYFLRVRADRRFHSNLAGTRQGTFPRRDHKGRSFDTGHSSGHSSRRTGPGHTLVKAKPQVQCGYWTWGC